MKARLFGSPAADRLGYSEIVEVERPIPVLYVRRPNRPRDYDQVFATPSAPMSWSGSATDIYDLHGRRGEELWYFWRRMEFI